MCEHCDRREKAEADLALEHARAEALFARWERLEAAAVPEDWCEHVRALRQENARRGERAERAERERDEARAAAKNLGKAHKGAMGRLCEALGEKREALARVAELEGLLSDGTDAEYYSETMGKRGPTFLQWLRRRAGLDKLPIPEARKVALDVMAEAERRRAEAADREAGLDKPEPAPSPTGECPHCGCPTWRKPEPAMCRACGKPFSARVCGPAHAIRAHEMGFSTVAPGSGRDPACATCVIHCAPESERKACREAGYARWQGHVFTDTKEAPK